MDEYTEHFKNDRVYFSLEGEDGCWKCYGYIDGKRQLVSCVSKHCHAVNAGLRWKRREMQKLGLKGGF